MKIAIPVEDNTAEARICSSFGRAAYFLLYDTSKEEVKFVANTAAASANGTGIGAAQIIADEGAKVLITPRCGKNAADILLAAGVKIYRSTDFFASENIESFLQGKLDFLTEIHAGLHQHG